MNGMRGFRLGLAALSLALVGSATAQQGRDPLVREGVTEKISEHVYVIPDFSTPVVPNVGIIVGTRATLVVDTGLGPRNGEAILREVAKVSANRELYLVTTHTHPEHDLGASAFKGWKLIRSGDQVRETAVQGPGMARAFASRSPMMAELLKDASFRPADITFDNEYRLDLGGVAVGILAMGLNHTQGDTAVFIEPDRVLFSGDVAMPGQPSFATAGATLTGWTASLDRLAALKPDKVVPSHGPMGGVAMIDGYKTYFRLITRRVAELKAEGKPQDQTIQTLPAELRDRYPDAGRLAGAIRAAW